MTRIRTLLGKIPVFPFEGPAKVAYNAFLIFSALAGTIITSYRLTFKLYDFDAIYWIITVVYILDIPYTFNQSVKKGLKISTDRPSIARQYLRGWFAVDIVASIPFAWLFYVSGKEHKKPGEGDGCHDVHGEPPRGAVVLCSGGRWSVTLHGLVERVRDVQDVDDRDDPVMASKSYRSTVT